MSCLSENVLSAFVDGHLSATEKVALHEHVDKCEDCRVLLVGIAGGSLGGAAASVPSTEKDITGPTQDIPAHPAHTSPPEVSGYRLIRRIGRGSMGEVYLAHDEQLDREVAVKFLSATAERASRKRFLTEARAVAKLKHPNIVTIYSCDISGERPYIVSEFLSGQSLDRASIPLPATEVLQIALALASGLSVAHRAGVLHRDIKPANVMRTEEGEIKLLDFGLAKLAGATSEHEASEAAGGFVGASMLGRALTQTGALVGTPLYMAPEVWAGKQASAASDVFSLGAMLYELCAGQTAYKATSLEDLRREVGESSPPPLAQHRPQVPVAFARVIDKCLAREPGDRFASAVELSAALAETTKKAGKVRWNRRTLGGVAALCVALGGGAFAMRTGAPPSANVSLLTSNSALTFPEQAKNTRRTIAILPFFRPGLSPAPGWLSTALGELLGACFAAGETLRVVSGEEVARMLTDLELSGRNTFSADDLHRMRQYSGIDLILAGTLDRSGQEPNLRLRAQIQDVKSSALVSTAEADGPESTLSVLALTLGGKLLPALGQLPISAAQEAQVRASVPNNPLGARLFAEGLERFRANDFEAASDRLSRAAKADPESPVPHQKLSSLASFLGQDETWRREAILAFERSQGLREHRLQIEARYHRARFDKRRAVETLRMLRDLFPDNVEYGIELAQEQPRDEALATLASLRNLPAPAGDDPRIDLAEYQIAAVTGDGILAAERAAEKGRARGQRYIVGVARSMQGWGHWDQGNVQLAEAAFEEALPILEARGDTFNATEVMRGLGAIATSGGQLDVALELFQKAETHLARIGNEASYVYALRNVGSALRMTGDLKGARKKFEQALFVAERAGNKDRMAQTYWFIGVLEHGAGNMDAARNAYETAFQLAADLNDPWLARIFMGDAGRFYTAVDEPDKARQAFEKIISGKDAEGRKRTAIPNRRDFAELELSLDHLDEALRLVDEAISEATREGASMEIARAEVVKANILLAKKNSEAAIPLVDDALKRVEHAKNVVGRIRVLIGWAHVHASARTQNPSANVAQDELKAVKQALSTAVSEAKRTGLGEYIPLARVIGCEVLEAEQGASNSQTCFMNASKEAKTAGFLLLARKTAERASPAPPATAKP